MSKYDNPDICPACDGQNFCETLATEAGVPLEIQTHCTNCGQGNFWAHGRYQYARKRAKKLAVKTWDEVKQSSDKFKRIRLTEEAQKDADAFESGYGLFNAGCTCMNGNPPCGFCTDPGNPDNLNENDEAWLYEEVSEAEQQINEIKGSW